MAENNRDFYYGRRNGTTDRPASTGIYYSAWESKLHELMVSFLTHFQTANFRLFKWKEFADNDFKFDENGSNISKRLENTVGKGEIACYKQFLLFPQCFQKACFPRTSKGCYVGMG